MKEINRQPIGLGIGNLEAEITACHIWNRTIQQGKSPTDWIESDVLAHNANFADWQSRISLINTGCAETNEEKTQVRLTEKGAALCKAFSEK